MKKLYLLLLVTISLMLTNLNVFAADTPAKVIIDGVDSGYEVTVLQIDDNVFVPIRPIFESMNYKIEWDQKRQHIYTSTALGKLVIGIGSNFVCLNQYQAYVLDDYPRIFKGQSMIPIKFAAECTDSSISYVESTNTVVIATN